MHFFKYAPRVELYEYFFSCILYGSRPDTECVSLGPKKGNVMAQDYDFPRNKDEDEESLQALGKSSQNSASDLDDDENAIAEDYELPGADLSNEDSSVTVIPKQGAEFIRSE